MLENDKQVSSDLATIILVLVYVGQLFSGPIFGNLGDKQYKRSENGRLKLILTCLVVGSILYIIAYSLTFTVVDTVVLVVFIILLCIGAFFFGGIDPLTQVTLGEINPPQTRTTIFSINYLAYAYGRSISIFLVGTIFIFSGNVYQLAYIIVSFILLASSLFFIPLLKSLPKDLQSIKEKQRKK
jgi:MFS family permease